MESNLALNRISLIRNQLAQTEFNAGKFVNEKHPDDVVIVSAKRTPLTRFKKGLLRETAHEILVQHVLQGVCEDSKIDKALVQEVVFGNVSSVGSSASLCRMGQFLAGFPHIVPSYSINRMCSSGLQAIAEIANSIVAGQIDIGIAGGVENMTLYPMNLGIDLEKLSEEAKNDKNCQNCNLSMGVTSENVAEQYKVTRDEQDEMAFNSHANAAKSQQSGFFEREIVPVKTKVEGKEVVVTQDDGIRKETTLQSLGKLKPVFKNGGTTTAGNSSQITDGAAAVLLARRSVAEKLKLPIKGKFLSYAVAGVPPEVMGIGPAFAIPLALKKAGLTVDQVDVFELNEAFASQATYCMKYLGIPKEKVNPNGGAIALGHPLGCTGARQTVTLFNELHSKNKKIGVVSMCIGTGMGAAGIFVRE